MKWERLQERIGYRFGDRAILLQALTHRSYGHEKFSNKPLALRDNERFEFLGDAVLDLIISDILLETYPNSHEGQLSKMRAAVVNEKTLTEVTKGLRLSECLRLGKGEQQTGGAFKPSILSSAFEALIAAIYLDGGFSAVYPVVRHLFAQYFQAEQDISAFYDHKTRLQEMVQARWKVTPRYRLMSAIGPDHAKVFEVQVELNGDVISKATGSSKKQAEQNAALHAIQSITT